jgi:hypothetical protein
MSMPVSAVAVLALPRLEDLENICLRLNLPWKPLSGYDSGYSFSEKIVEPVADVVDGSLQDVYLQLIRRELDASATFASGSPSATRYVLAATPLGPRQLIPFRLQLVGDYETESNDDWTEDFCVGVPLSSRYYPTWLDWEDEHGTDGTLRINIETLRRIELARAALLRTLPEFADAELVSKTLFY